MGNETIKTWVCTVCGYEHEGDSPPEVCPICGAAQEDFELEEQPTDDTSSAKQIWICSVCGYVHEGDSPPEECPVCGADKDAFEEQAESDQTEDKDSLHDYLKEWAKDSDTFEEKFARLSALAKGEASEIKSMRTQKHFPDWELILFKGAQLYRQPLNEDEEVSTTTIIGTSAQKPITLQFPFYVSHMSFGALSKEAKIALAKGSKQLGTMICSGEGGLLPEEQENAGCYIYELGTAAFSHRDEAMKKADGVEIKIGQAAKPGMGGHVPKEKITEEIANIRGIEVTEDSISPGRPYNISNQQDLIDEVKRIRELIDGKPVGIKIAAGHIEDDLDFALKANPDFITIDCRGGATGAAAVYIKDNVCIPPIFAIRRARRFLDKQNSKVTLCVTGGFRDAADIAKGLALGADAIALATASLIGIGCQQYRICHTGNCPVGITTQDENLRSRFDIDKSVERFVNLYSAIERELKNFARINGRNNVHDLDLSDIVTISNEVSQNTDIEHV